MGVHVHHHPRSRSVHVRKSEVAVYDPHGVPDGPGGVGGGVGERIGIIPTDFLIFQNLVIFWSLLVVFSAFLLFLVHFHLPLRGRFP